MKYIQHGLDNNLFGCNCGISDNRLNKTSIDSNTMGLNSLLHVMLMTLKLMDIVVQVHCFDAYRHNSIIIITLINHY